MLSRFEILENKKDFSEYDLEFILALAAIRAEGTTIISLRRNFLCSFPERPFPKIKSGKQHFFNAKLIQTTISLTMSLAELLV